MKMEWILTVEQIENPEEVNPCWQRIYDVFCSLDGKETKNFTLELVDVRTLYCGGGNLIKREKRYIVNYVSEDADVNSRLIDPAESEEEYYELMIQTSELYPATWCVTKDKAVEAIKYFYEKGKLSKDHSWEYLVGGPDT
jgi:Immunity protein Imm1